MSDANDDVLDGYSEIGLFLRMTDKQAKHRALAGEIPTFQIGRRRYARRSTLLAWMAEQEAKSVKKSRGA